MTGTKLPPLSPMQGQASRRVFLRRAASAAGALGIVAAAQGCATRPPTPGTKPKSEAAYQDQPHGLARCGLCKHFYSPDICEIVAGSVSPQGWCKFYALL
jgi:hypothetical protein